MGEGEGAWPLLLPPDLLVPPLQNLPGAPAKDVGAWVWRVKGGGGTDTSLRADARSARLRRRRAPADGVPRETVQRDGPMRATYANQ